MNNTKHLARISSSYLEKFLVELANLGDDPRSLERFQQRFSNLVPLKEGSLTKLNKQRNELNSDEKKLVDMAQEGLEEEELQTQLHWLWDVKKLRDLIRAVWTEPDLRTKEYNLFLLQQKALAFAEGDSYLSSVPLRKLPPPTPLEQTFLYLRKVAHRARYCENPECFSPYFIAKRRNQKYCSDACAKPAQREYKRQWWAEHGEEWRATRKKSAKKGKQYG